MYRTFGGADAMHSMMGEGIDKIVKCPLILYEAHTLTLEGSSV